MIIERFLAWLETAPEEDRERAAFALADVWLEPDIDDSDRDTTEAALTLLLEDESRQVRLALAEAFACIDSAPRHLVHALAGDEPEIAAVVLLNSHVFLDGELSAIVKGGVREQQVAIASRAQLGLSVCATIATHGEVDAVMTLLDNPGADMRPEALHVIAERHGGDADVRRKLHVRENILPQTRLALIDHLSTSLRARMLAEDTMPAARIEQVLAHHAERAIITLAASATETELPEIAGLLIAQGRMTTAFLLRALCLGNIALVSTALSQLSGMPASRVEATISSGRRTAFRALYIRCGLPESAFDVFANAIEIWRKVLSSEEGADGHRLTWLVTRELLSTYRGAPDPATDGLLVLLRRLAAEAARHNARQHAERIQNEMRERERLMIEMQAAAEEAGVTALIEAVSEIDIELAYPVIEVPAPVLANFAIHFAEELATLEDEFARAGEALIEHDLPLHSGPAANDDFGLSDSLLHIDLGDAILPPRRLADAA
jgi:uncharacterized protein (DUF2336 family)